MVADVPETCQAASRRGGRRDDGCFDAIVVGAGFAGLYALHLLRSMGLRVRVFEAGSDLGGTWYWNRYPGARCDVESMQYFYSFSSELEREWSWSETFATQPEILAYANHVADRFDLRRDIVFDATIESAHFDSANRRWRVKTSAGETFLSRFCVMASGGLSAIHPPEIDGIESFGGEVHHTGAWPHDGVDLRGKRVGIIGTGSSGIQAIPVIAASAASLNVFQRTPNYVLPSANRPMTPEYERDWKANYAALRAKVRGTRTGVLHNFGDKPAMSVTANEREAEYERRWKIGSSILAAYTDTYTNLEANAFAADFVREKIRQVVKDPAVAERLSPRGYPIGAKRVCIDSAYFETFNRPNVVLIDIQANPILSFVKDGIRTGEGVHELDVIVFATGFDAATGALGRIDIRGRSGRSLAEKWRDGPRTYLGLMVEDFPSLFIINGPGSAAALSNALLTLEHHVEWIAGAIGHMRDHGFDDIEPTAEAEDEWTDLVNSLAAGSIFAMARSWFNGSNVAGKPRAFLVYVGGFDTYDEFVRKVVADGYRGFSFHRNLGARPGLMPRNRQFNGQPGPS